MLSPRERELRKRFRDDFQFYAPRSLRIRTKSGSIEPLKLNKAQLHLHERLEEQIRRTGKVRALVLKGRQQGISTYIEGRFYWKVTHRKGTQAFILTHEQPATDNLFKMVSRYHEHCPPVLKPQTQASNAKELVFGRLDSGYKVGTAGSKGTGRSATIQFFHGSEVAFWPHADEHAAGVMQAVPDQAGTEVFLESTANGIGNFFHRMWQAAESGKSEYEAIFIPWYWQPEYRKACPPDFRPTEEETQYADLYGLDPEQIHWMRAKIAEFNGDVGLFNQEYPATAALAFSYSAGDPFVPANLIAAARKAQVSAPDGAVLAGLDPARGGGDRTALVIRKGRKVIAVRTWADTDDAMGIVGLAVQAKQEFGIDMMFVDSTDGGYGIVDRLREMNHGDWVKKVNFGDKASREDKYFNKRAEMWGMMRDWLKDAPVSIPDSDELQADLMAPSVIPPDSHGRTKLQAKKDIKKTGKRSPDLADALALTFAYPFVRERPKATPQPHHGGSQGWMAV